MRWTCLLGCALVLCSIATPWLQGGGKDGDKIVVDKEAKTVTIPAIVAPRKLPKLEKIYPIEVVATFPAPKGQKAHETVVNFNVSPKDVHKALESIGLKAGKPAFQGENGKATGPEVKIFFEAPGADGKAVKTPLEETMIDKNTGKTLPELKWLFTGSAMKNPDPEKDDVVYGANISGTLITIFPVTDDTVFQTSLTLKEEKSWKIETNPKVVPKEGTAVKLIIQAK